MRAGHRRHQILFLTKQARVLLVEAHGVRHLLNLLPLLERLAASQQVVVVLKLLRIRAVAFEDVLREAARTEQSFIRLITHQFLVVEGMAVLEVLSQHRVGLTEHGEALIVLVFVLDLRTVSHIHLVGVLLRALMHALLQVGDSGPQLLHVTIDRVEELLLFARGALFPLLIFTSLALDCAVSALVQQAVDLLLTSRLVIVEVISTVLL